MRHGVQHRSREAKNRQFRRFLEREYRFGQLTEHQFSQAIQCLDNGRQINPIATPDHPALRP